MFSLILIVLLGLGIALFAQQNTQTVSVTIGNYALSPIPVYLVSIISMLVGLVVAWVLSVMDFFTTAIQLRRKDSVISKDSQRIAQYEHEITELRQENAMLKGSRDDHAHDRIDYSDSEPKNYVETIRQRFSFHKNKGALS